MCIHCMYSAIWYVLIRDKLPETYMDVAIFFRVVTFSVRGSNVKFYMHTPCPSKVFPENSARVWRVHI